VRKAVAGFWLLAFGFALKMRAVMDAGAKAQRILEQLAAGINACSTR
jgi:hypothetical protein